MDNEKVYRMKFSSVYPLLVNKAVRKGRTQEEVDEVISWLTGYDRDAIKTLSVSDIDYASFFQKAPELNPRRELIKGVICGIRVEEIEEPLMKEIRYLDKLVDELAKGKAMDKILERQWMPKFYSWIVIPRKGIRKPSDRHPRVSFSLIEIS